MAVKYIADGSNDAPLILIYGYDIPATRELFHAIRAIKDERSAEVPIHTLPGYRGISGLELIFKSERRNEGIKNQGSLSFTCGLTPDGWNEVELLLSPFCDRFAQPGPFQWLNKDGDIDLLFSTHRGW